MSMEKMREQFEAAIAIETGMPEQYFRDDRDGESYVSVGPKYAWWGYQASRESLVIDLSDLSRCFSPNDCGDWAMWLDDVRVMVQAAGLKVKL